jgi:hypothetical protein
MGKRAMNIYFLVEGRRTEKKLYPKWIEHLIPGLTKVDYHDQVKENNYYIVSGYGFPGVIREGLDNAIDKISEVGKYNYLVICFDADESTVCQMEELVKNNLQEKNVNLGDTKVQIIIQKRCIETWFLGNREIFDSSQIWNSLLRDYMDYYDVSRSDPELMGNFGMINHSTFHAEYLTKILNSKGISYTKKFPRGVIEKEYLKQLQQRVNDESEHLKSFQIFLDFCAKVNDSIT